MQGTYDSDKRRLLSLICHGCTLAGISGVTIAAPIVILFISDDPVVKSNAKESINFHINIWFWASVIGGIYAVLSFLTFGLLGILLFPLIAFGFLWHFGWSIVAILKTLANSDEAFRYPFILHIF